MAIAAFVTVLPNQKRKQFLQNRSIHRRTLYIVCLLIKNCYFASEFNCFVSVIWSSQC
jgi:hypothetical protein